MKKKSVFIFLAIGLLAVILLGSIFTQDSVEAGGTDYDQAFYVDGSKNLFIMTAKFLDKCCFYVVDIVVSGIKFINLFLKFILKSEILPVFGLFFLE